LTTQLTAVGYCPQCGTELASTMIACPGCRRLVFTDRLNELAASARQATAQGDLSTALARWREALPLLPSDSRQFKVIAATITDLGQHVSAGSPSPVNTGDAKPAEPRSVGSRIAGGASAIGLLLWKLKTLLLGLTKASTFLSMLVSMGVYWTLFGWKFATGLVLSIYVHEMGHVITLRRYGFKATSPMFIPGLGALIRLQQQIVNPLEDAEIGLAGPIYGLGAALVAGGVWWATHIPIWAAIAGVGAWVNLFNLTPLGPLDGSRGFHAMSRPQKFLAAATAAAAWGYSQDGLLILVALVGLFRASSDKSGAAGSWKATITYMVLIIALTAVSLLRLQAHM
jgi:Zn-dependent protease